MTRRKFFQNLVASVATLVTAHALPLQKIKRLADPEGSFRFDAEEFVNIIEIPELRIRHFARSPWINLINRGEFPENMGDITRNV